MGCHPNGVTAHQNVVHNATVNHNGLISSCFVEFEKSVGAAKKHIGAVEFGKDVHRRVVEAAETAAAAVVAENIVVSAANPDVAVAVLQKAKNEIVVVVGAIAARVVGHNAPAAVEQVQSRRVGSSPDFSINISAD